MNSDVHALAQMILSSNENLTTPTENDHLVDWSIKSPAYVKGRLELEFTLAVRPPAMQLLGFFSRIAVKSASQGFIAADSFSLLDSQQLRGGAYLNLKLPPGKYEGSHLVMAYVQLKPDHQVWPMRGSSFTFEV